MLDPLKEEAYISLHLAYDMPHWASPTAKNKACKCASFPGMCKVSLEDDLHINLDCDNVLVLTRRRPTVHGCSLAGGCCMFMRGYCVSSHIDVL